MFRFVLIAILFVTDGAFAAEDLFAGAPPTPPGYTDYKGAEAALKSGAVASVNHDPPVPGSVQFFDDVTYATRDSGPLKLDLYVPKDAATPPPLVMFVHGGAWRSGKKEDEAFYAVPLAAAGYATATIQYRLAPEHVFPAAMLDVNAALAWLRDRADEYGYDGERLAVFGGSAGSHLQLLAAYADSPELGTTEANERIQAVINIYGVVDLRTQEAKDSSWVADFLGGSFEDREPMYILASPIVHVDAGDPPTLTLHGTADELVPFEQGKQLHETLGALGVPSHFDALDGWHHSMDEAQPVFERCLFLTERFLNKYLPLQHEEKQYHVD